MSRTRPKIVKVWFPENIQVDTGGACVNYETLWAWPWKPRYAVLIHANNGSGKRGGPYSFLRRDFPLGGLYGHEIPGVVMDEFKEEQKRLVDLRERE